METWLMQGQSLCILLLMIVGATLHRRRSLHVKIMSAAMIWDVILILQIELSRSAIIKASNAGTNPMLLNIHVSIAVTSVILYGFMVHSGRKVLAGDRSILPRHKRLGYLTLIMRTLTFITSFWAVAPKG